MLISGDIYHPLSLPQIFGYIATIFGIIAFQQRDDNRMRIFVCAMSCFIVTHFILMGAMTAAITSALAASRWGLSMFTRIRKFAPVLVPGYIVLFLVTGYLAAENWYDYLPVIASCTGSYALFYLQKIKLRVVLFFGGSLWVIHNFFALSYGPLVMEVFICLSNAVMIYRFYAENKKLPRDPDDSFLSRFG